mmetsp:Transcript_6238/g.17464  ORF Transcript_6238/g.17464 Transcript_6238/m.17464 type:complete len:160 (+) Transcript_6238:1157-1636(+)
MDTPHLPCKTTQPSNCARATCCFPHDLTAGAARKALHLGGYGLHNFQKTCTVPPRHRHRSSKWSFLELICEACDVLSPVAWQWQDANLAILQVLTITATWSLAHSCLGGMGLNNTRRRVSVLSPWTLQAQSKKSVVRSKSSPVLPAYLCEELWAVPIHP